MFYRLIIHNVLYFKRPYVHQKRYKIITKMTISDVSAETSTILIVVSAVSVTTVIIAFLGCLWCRNKWKKWSQRHYQLSNSAHEASVSPIQNLTEFTIFPPPSSNQFSLPTGISPDKVVFEPLPEIRSRVLGPTSENLRPARFTGCCEKISLQDWFDEHQTNFPRNHLKYLQEVGPTWYGQAVEGEAYNIRKPEEKTKVVVKILRVDATSTELMQYLQETRPFRDLKHPNLLNLLNRCLEVHPFLLIMEHCELDLKSFLIEQRKSPEMLLKNGSLLSMASNITSALQYMHEHGFIHMDVAAHSCLVTSDGVVKLGDYGTAVHIHRSDFCCLGDVALPIRWCAPESLMCTESIIEAKDITREANIWSFGVLLWELLEFGKLPYVNVNDSDLIQKVLIECTLKLEQPKTPCVHKDMIYKIMQLCWLPAALRPTIQKISTLLNYLYDNRDVLSESSAFEFRWNSLQPVLREHNLSHTPANLSLRFESDFTPKRRVSTDFIPSSSSFMPKQRINDLSMDSDSVVSAEFNERGDKSPSSSSFSMGDLADNISPSLLNLRGSMEDLISDNGVASETCSLTPAYGDTVQILDNETQIGERLSSTGGTSETVNLPSADSDVIQLKISEAIRDLDSMLADELDSSEFSSPEKRVENSAKHSDARDTKQNGAMTANHVNVNLEVDCGQRELCSGDLQKIAPSDQVSVNVVD